MRRALIAAILTPVCYFGTLLIAGLFFPGYSHVAQLPSELGAVGAPHPLVFNVGLIITGLAFAGAGTGLGRAAIELGASRPVAAGLFFTLLAPAVYFPLVALITLPDPRHNALFPLLLPVIIGPVLLGFGLRRRSELRDLRRFLVTTVVALGLLVVIALGVGGFVDDRNDGLFIRVFALVAFGWIGVAGAALRQSVPGPR